MVRPANALAIDPAIAIRDQFLGPCLLAPFAGDMARRLARINKGPLLEIGADTGVLTQAASLAMSADVTIVASDPDPAAIEHAQCKPGMARIAWQTADAHSLPFQDATFGMIACLFAAAMFDDRAQAFADVRRVMKPGGRFVFAVPAHIRHNPVADCIDQALARVYPADPIRFLGQVLHGYADNEAIDDDLTAAGFTDATYTVLEMPFAAARARDVAMGYCQGLGLRRELAMLGDDGVAVNAATAALQQRFGDGPINTTMRAQLVVASG